jgi:hypothetical protein
LAPDHRSALRVSELMASSRQAMKTADRRKPNGCNTAARTPSLWRGRSEPISLDRLGWEARKTPAAGEVFFLDFPLYRTPQMYSTQLAFANAAAERGFADAEQSSCFV